MTVSVVLFLVYLDRFVHSLRPVAVAWAVAEAGARVFRASEPGARDEAPERPGRRSGARGAQRDAPG